MLKVFVQLLGVRVDALRHYVRVALIYGLLCGLTALLLMPVLSHLLKGEVRAAIPWLALQALGVGCCWALRRQVERAGIAVGLAVLQGGRQRLGTHIAELPVGWFSALNTARLNHLVTQGMMEIAQLPAHVFTPLLIGVVSPVVVLVALLILNPLLGLIALVSLPLLLGVFCWTARLSQGADQVYQTKTALASQRMLEFAQAQSVLRAFNGEEGGTRFLEEALSQQQASGRQVIRLSGMSSLLNTWAVQMMFAAMLALAALQIGAQVGGGTSLDSVVALIVTMSLVVRFIDPLLDVAAYSEVLRAVRGQLKAVADIFSANPLPESAQPLVPLDASVELCGVGFRYEEGQKDVLREFSLRIEPGSMTALVGASGSGKSSVLKLIARFFDVQRGAVKLGGVDVRDISSELLAQQISQIFQESFLFQGSIADNIRIGKPDASEEEVLAAAAQAGVTEILERLPQGIETPVGEGGARLSGGERQRIGIARALIKSAPILLVDEATAALDAENQAAISESLARLRGRRTMIVIAHQLSTVEMADQIVVLEHGQAREQGSHAELSALGGTYAHFLAQRRAAKGWRIQPGLEANS